LEKLIAAIEGRLVAIDTAPFIYYIEKNPKYFSIVDSLFNAVDTDNARAVTSVLTLQEVLVHPLRKNQTDLAERYREILTNSVNLTLVTITPDIAENASKLRAAYHWLRSPDAFQIATAIETGAHVLITNDENWKKVTEISVLTLDDVLSNL
jgi:predicted nucleic acid-binding protein